MLRILEPTNFKPLFYNLIRPKICNSHRPPEQNIKKYFSKKKKNIDFMYFDSDNLFRRLLKFGFSNFS